MIDSTTRPRNDAANEAAPETWRRHFLLADNYEIHATVAAVIANGIGANVCDSNSHGDGLAFQILLAWTEHVDFNLAACWNGQKEKGGE
jgi:hypothetical protein